MVTRLDGQKWQPFRKKADRRSRVSSEGIQENFPRLREYRLAKIGTSALPSLLAAICSRHEQPARMRSLPVALLPFPVEQNPKSLEIYVVALLKKLGPVMLHGVARVFVEKLNLSLKWPFDMHHLRRPVAI